MRVLEIYIFRFLSKVIERELKRIIEGEDKLSLSLGEEGEISFR